MDYFLMFVGGIAVGVALTAISALLWVYEPEDIPPLHVVVEHAKGVRSLIRIIREGSDALSQMAAEVRRRP